MVVWPPALDPHVRASGRPAVVRALRPQRLRPDRTWPTILFLHGAGEGGHDGLLPTEYQLGSAIRRNAAGYPGLVVFPQLRQYQPLWTSTDVQYALDVLDHVQQTYSCDADRIYLTGVSTGARAAWHALYRHPDRFAAALIVAGMVRLRQSPTDH